MTREPAEPLEARGVNVSFNNNNVSESTIRPYNDAGTHPVNFEDTEGDTSGGHAHDTVLDKVKSFFSKICLKVKNICSN